MPCVCLAAAERTERGWGRCGKPCFRPGASDCAALDEPLVVGETRPTTLLFADPPTALAVTAEGASCVARAVPSGSVSCMLAAPRVPTDRFKRGVPAQGESPAPRPWKRRAARSQRVVRRSLQPTRDNTETKTFFQSVADGRFVPKLADLEKKAVVHLSKRLVHRVTGADRLPN